MVRLCDPACPGWSPLYEKSNVKAMKQPGSFVCVKGEGLVAFPIHDIFRIVLWTERMVELDLRMHENHRIKPLCISASFEYFRWKPVWPTAARDMCNMNHWRRLPDGRVVIVSFAATDPMCPEVTGCVRAECILGGYVFEQVPGGTLVRYLVQTDLKGSIPTSVASFVAEEQPLVIDVIRKVLGGDVQSGKVKGMDFPLGKKQRVVTYDGRWCTGVCVLLLF